VVRAFEVFWTTGRPLSAHHSEGAVPLQGFRIRIVGLDPGREALGKLIEERTRRMLEQGLLDEVRGLLERYPPDIRPLSAIGYRQAVAVIRGRMSDRELKRAIVTATLRFAKRQRTWFRHQVEAEWHRDGEGARDGIAAWLDRPPPSA
jgi:tRNA dimethylallyltransferase